MSDLKLYQQYFPVGKKVNVALPVSQGNFSMIGPS